MSTLSHSNQNCKAILKRRSRLTENPPNGGERKSRTLTSGRGEIRTRESIAALVVFKTTALVHYATLPSLGYRAERVGFEPTRAILRAQGVSNPPQ